MQTSQFVSTRAATAPRICSKITSERIEMLRHLGRDVLSLKPYPEVPLPSHVLDAATRAARENHAVPSIGTKGLRHAVAEKLERESGWLPDPTGQIVVTNGAMHALNLIMRAILNPGDNVVFPIPAYFFYGPIELAGGEARMIPTSEDRGWAWDLDQIDEAITARTKALMIHSPTNPTGRVLSREQIERLVDIAEKHDVLIIYDESYDRLVYDGHRHASPASLPRARERLVIVQSLTKSFAMSPWRVGYVVAPTEIAFAITKLLEWDVLMCSHVGQAAAEAALSGPDDWLLNIAKQFEAQRNTIYAAIGNIPGITCRKPEGGPFLFLNVCQARGGEAEFWRVLLDEYGVPTEPGSFFKGPGYLRLAFGADCSVLEEAGERIKTAAEHMLK